MSRHTKEPWSFGSKSDLTLYIGNQNGDIIADNIVDIEDAMRIVACVNACAGFETEHLENLMLVGDDVMRQAADEIKQLRQQAAKLEDAVEWEKSRADANYEWMKSYSLQVQVLREVLGKVVDNNYTARDIAEALSTAPQQDEWIRRSEIEEVAWWIKRSEIFFGKQKSRLNDWLGKER